jgi:5-methylcytosine-specific restriction endonuclease McrA
MKETPYGVTEIDFVTCGVKPQGELFHRASQTLCNSKSLLINSDRMKNTPLGVAGRLVERYVEIQKHIFKSYNVLVEDWYARTLVQVFMTRPYLQNPLQAALKFREQIENAAKVSELYAVALDIIHEYETYRRHEAEIKKHVKIQRKIIDSNRANLLIVLEQRDGLVCKGCGLIENLLTNYKIDHKIPLTLGGVSVLDNLQLLCGFCNSSKGNRPMDYLFRRMKKARK